jgi:amino acid adenylation domain-containing protein
VTDSRSSDGRKGGSVVGAARSPLLEQMRQAGLASPDRPAVMDDTGSLTHREVWDRAGQLAAILLEGGLEPEGHVGFWAQQNCDLLVGVLGILLAGGVYVPLDPTYPEDRLRYVTASADLVTVVAAHRDVRAAAALGVPVTSLGELSGVSPAMATAAPGRTDAAYVIYTSGSTGRPKGVVVEHASIADLLAWIAKAIDIGPGDRVMQTAPLAFDASIQTILLPLVTGGTLCAVPSEAGRDPYVLADAIAKYRPKALSTSPMMLRMLMESGWAGDPDLTVLTGAERMTPDSIRYIAPRVKSLFNQYGPTEATVVVTMAALRPEDAMEPPIGVPRPGIECLVLDGERRPVAAGSAGELYILGGALARGYYGSPELTEERFVMISAGTSAPRRAYRTGDIVRQREDGDLVHVGRLDDQVKVRGYRVEPGEIERVLLEHPDVTGAVVVAQGFRAPNANPPETGRPAHRGLGLEEWDELRLYAFVTGGLGLDVSALRAHAKERLPSYMVPADFLVLDEFPVTMSQKVDKAELRKRLESKLMSTGYPPSPPRRLEALTPIEASVRDLIADVLSLEPEEIAPTDDFFDLGGTSLRALRLCMTIEGRFKVRLPLSILTTHSTVVRIADAIGVYSRSSLTEASDGYRYEWERVLAQAWSEILDVHDIGRTSDFFKLGGDAMSATALIDLLANSYRVDFTIDQLRRHSTLEALAEATSRHPRTSSVVPVTATGSAPAFFCVAGAGGLAMSFLPLARRLGPDQPFYGLQAHGLENRGRPDFTLRRAARRHARAIRAIQPHGPYFVGGHSLGGIIALLIAQELALAGEQVPLLVILDTQLPHLIGSVSAAFNKSPSKEPEERLKLSTVVRLPLAGIVPQKGIRQFHLFGLHGSVQLRYAQLRPWPGPTLLYTAGPEDGVEIESSWRRLLTGPVSTVPVPGDHLRMMHQPNVNVLAEDLRRRLEQAANQNGPLPRRAAVSIDESVEA